MPNTYELGSSCRHASKHLLLLVSLLHVRVLTLNCYKSRPCPLAFLRVGLICWLGGENDSAVASLSREPNATSSLLPTCRFTFLLRFTNAIRSFPVHFNLDVHLSLSQRFVAFVQHQPVVFQVPYDRNILPNGAGYFAAK